MWKNILFYVLSCSLYSTLYAHEVDKVYYKISEKENTIIIEADFSWALRNALITFQPNLKEATSSTEYDIALRRYVLENLILKDTKDKFLKLQRITLLKNEESHNHGNKYAFTFQKGVVKHITNTLLFNIHKYQTNIHSIENNGIWSYYKTTPKNHYIALKTTKLNLYWWLLLPLSLLLIFIFQSKKIQL